MAITQDTIITVGGGATAKSFGVSKTLDQYTLDDLKAFKIARDLKDKIENELTYPGQIKVTVIREVRANEVAK